MTELMTQIVDRSGGGSRRTFIAGAAGLAVGAASITALTDSGTVPSTSLVDDALEDAMVSTGALVAYVKDLAAGEIAVMRGDTEVVVVDHALAQALARLVR